MLSLFDSGPFQPCPAPFNLAGHVLARADALGGKTAVAVIGAGEPETLSYAELLAAVLGTAGGFKTAGFRPGDRVLMRLGNTLDFPIAYLGALAGGLVPVPTSSALTEPEVARIVAELRPRVILHDPDVATATGAPHMGVHTLRALRTHAPGKVHLSDPNRLGYIVYTSGTSGQPRAVGHAHRAIWARQMMFQHWYGLSETDVILHAGAFNWTYTLGTGLMDPWTVGATALIPAPGTKPEALGDLLRRHDATLFAAAPGVYRQMLERGALPTLPRLRHGLSAGEKMPSALHARWSKATGTPIYEAYGMSECSTFISSSPGTPCTDTALGRPQPGRKVAILGSEGPVPVGTSGTIAVHRDDPGLMLEYLNAPDETADKYQGDWFLTGDTGQMNAAGEITYLGRSDDMMNAGGFRVSPVEVEMVVANAPGVASCGVAEVELAPGKRIIVAFYTGREATDETVLHDHAAARLARYKQPRAYVHLPLLPLGPNGKLVRRRLHQFWPKSRKTPS
ncbi:class I adenylate-forming enzyme family protein [uncultured Tateyamaria sp.]|uniref:class I adenylate-forming enzyme family protein n=1 Tax=Tateyamaria sp. 1078 TaxID=3417464 RepID=UPI0026088C67|nr:class I adenylate-forming enzyme family protein [uncultured Tateyamaria sp.]